MIFRGSYDAELKFALGWISQACDRIRIVANSTYDIGYKEDGTPVTAVDRMLNRWFIERVAEHFPRDRVLGEELCRDGDGPRTWVIDPLDGTQQFMLRIPVWTIAIALTDENGCPVLGVVCNPSVRKGSGNLYWAVDRGGAFRDGLQIQVSARDFSMGSVWIRGEATTRVSDELSGTLLEVGLASGLRVTEHRIMPAVFASCLVAEGSLDGVIYTASGAHDLAAGCVIVREAGGKVTDLSGADQRYDRPVNGGVLTNVHIHGRLLRQCVR